MSGQKVEVVNLSLLAPWDVKACAPQTKRTAPKNRALRSEATIRIGGEMIFATAVTTPSNIAVVRDMVADGAVEGYLKRDAIDMLIATLSGFVNNEIAKAVIDAAKAKA